MTKEKKVEKIDEILEMIQVDEQSLPTVGETIKKIDELLALLEGRVKNESKTKNQENR